MGFPCGSAGKESDYNVGDLGSVPGLGKSPGEGNSYLLQYSGLENVYVCVYIYMYAHIHVYMSYLVTERHNILLATYISGKDVLNV